MKFQDALDKSFALTEAVQKNLWDMYAVGGGNSSLTAYTTVSSQRDRKSVGRERV